MGAPARSMGLTTTCRVGVDLEMLRVFSQSIATELGGAGVCAMASGAMEMPRHTSARTYRVLGWRGCLRCCGVCDGMWCSGFRVRKCGV